MVLAGVSLGMLSMASAQEPAGRVVNGKTKSSVVKPLRPTTDENRPLEPAPSAPAPLEKLEPVADEANTGSSGRLTDEVSEGTTSEGTTSEVTDETTSDVTGEESTPAAEGEVIRTFEEIKVPEEEKRRAAAAKATATAEEQAMAGRIRGLQAAIEKEEQLLAQRLEYASRVRAKGLTDNDPKLLEQAEKYERAALTEYEKKVRQFEAMRVANPNEVQPQLQSQTRRPATSPSTTRSAPATRSTKKPTNSSRR
jgi:hypothetical protein